MFWKKKQSREKLTVSGVLDKHLGTYVRISVAHKLMLTSLLVVGVVVTIANTVIKETSSSKSHIAHIQIKGEISENNKAGNGLLFSRAFEKAANDSSAQVIYISASSGGGSPTQSEMIYKTIRDYVKAPLSERKLVVTSMQDMCASACLASVIASDEIYVHENTLVGSIGVRMSGYSIERALDMLGVKQQTLTSGSHKDFLDPYKSRDEKEEAFIKANIIMPLHEIFVGMVKEARGSKLNLDNELLFSGMVWVGSEGVNQGLADYVMTTAELERKLKLEYDTDEIKTYNKESFSFSNMLSLSIERAIGSVLKSEIEVRY